jgi:PhnB protein
MPDHDLTEQLDQAIESVLASTAAPPVRDPALAPLMNIATALRHFPAEGFKERLKQDLERRALMPTATSTPVGFRTITPFLIHAQAPDLVDFMIKTFGAEELKRNTAGVPDGFYSEVRIGDTVLMIAGGSAARRGNLPSALHVYVDDCDAAWRRALDAGATTLMGSVGEPADRPYGERSAYVEDAFGNYWYIATRLGPAPERTGSVLPHVHPQKARPYIDFLTRAFGAEPMQIVEHAGRVMHAAVRLGDAVLEMGEPDDRTGIPTNGLFVFVDDVDAAYARAVAAGATAIRPPDNEPAEMRSAIVRDPEGYLWWPASWMPRG